MCARTYIHEPRATVRAPRAQLFFVHLYACKRVRNRVHQMHHFSITNPSLQYFLFTKSLRFAPPVLTSLYRYFPEA